MKMGVPGVALGTLIAQWLTALTGTWVIVSLIGQGPLLTAVRNSHTWMLSRFRRIMVINGFLFIRTVFLFRCPHCGRGSNYGNRFRIAETCTDCGFILDPDDSVFLFLH